jgi:hypothetical protein
MGAAPKTCQLTDYGRTVIKTIDARHQRELLDAVAAVAL